VEAFVLGGASTTERAPGQTTQMALLQPSHRVVVFGGYNQYPRWLTATPSGVVGRVVGFIPPQNEQPAAVVKLDHDLLLPDGAGAATGQLIRGRYLVLELGHVGTDWATPEPRIHVELCDFEPEAAAWQDRGRGAWVESHATYRVLPEQPLSDQ
jgi:hypothetical protein